MGFYSCLRKVCCQRRNTQARNGKHPSVNRYWKNAASGAIGRRGSYLSQTQVAVYMPQMLAGNAMERTSEPYQLGVRFLDVIVPLLERDYYPDLTGTEGG